MHKTPFATQMFKRPVQTLWQLSQIVKFCSKISPFYSTNFPRVISRAFHLCNEHGYLPDEAFRFGLFDPNFPSEELPRCISRKNVTKIQKLLNPASWASLLRDKSIFYRYCMAVAVPIPKLYAIFFKSNAGWSYDGSALATRDDWEKFFRLQLPCEFVTKPAQGAYGQGVNFFSRAEDEFIDASWQSYKTEHLYDALLANLKGDALIIQEQLKNHPELIRFTDTGSLQTVRILTFVDTGGRCHIFHAHLKLILGQSVVDNWQCGLVGNASAAISLSNGFLEPAVIPTSDGSVPRTVSTHPKTGVPFNQFRLPFWPEVCSLVNDTAIKLLPVRTIGWDIAITPNGPVILEGNIWWDPSNQHRRMDVVLDALGCGPHQTRTHKTCILDIIPKTPIVETKRNKKRVHKTHWFTDAIELQVRDFFRIVRFCRTVTPLYSPDYLKVFLRALRLWRKEKFSPKEAFQLGLLKPDTSNTESSKCISIPNMTKILLSINPASWSPLLSNKGIFYRYCTVLGVPIPKLYAIFFRETAGWSQNSPVLVTRDDWEKFLDLRLPSEFVIKPSEGFLGRRVNVFTRTDKGFIDGSGKQYNTEDIYDDMFSDPKYDSFVIQERLKNHPELIHLTDNQFLQTVRIITFVDTAGCCHILHAHLKMILGQSVVDNWQRGLTGNAESTVSLSDGLLEPAVTLCSNGSGLRTMPTHPKTGVSFDQFRLPFWSEVCSLVKETAIKLLPVRTIGWDVAITPNGPVILEANIWWSAPNEHRRMHIILEMLSGNSK